ncbi:MAG: hypothetical protein JWQ98_570 [Chlorobi bacterium]|nr:hypothetical protein [Chlorobiota bacterium]
MNDLFTIIGSSFGQQVDGIGLALYPKLSPLSVGMDQVVRLQMRPLKSNSPHLWGCRDTGWRYLYPLFFLWLMNIIIAWKHIIRVYSSAFNETSRYSDAFAKRTTLLMRRSRMVIARTTTILIAKCERVSLDGWPVYTHLSGFITSQRKLRGRVFAMTKILVLGVVCNTPLPVLRHGVVIPSPARPINFTVSVCARCSRIGTLGRASCYSLCQDCETVWGINNDEAGESA